MKLTDEQKVKAKIYRDNMTEAQKESVRLSKRQYGERKREENKVKRALYYAANKESMNESSRAYHQKERDLKNALKMTGAEFRVLKHKPKAARVINQPATMVSLKEIAEMMGVIVAIVRAIQKDDRFNMPIYQLLRIDGAELFDRVEIINWIRENNVLLSSICIAGLKRKNKGEYKVSNNVMLLINWLQDTKHVSEYCNKQRVAINSNQFWARWM